MTTPSAPRPSRHAEPSSALPAWGALCFFVSGAAGLLYEVTWSKQLTYSLGNSLHAVATVVAAFLCGLALGARWLGVPLARRGNGGRVYAGLEAAVALLGVLSLPVLRGLEPLVGQLYRGLGGEGASFAVARFVLLFGVLVPPAALMGATLPVMVAHFERGRVGPALARLYAINTFGAVAGSVAAGFVLLPNLGLLGTTWVAAALNIGVAALAWSASAVRAQTPAPAGAAATPRRPAAKPAPPAERSLVGAATAAEIPEQELITGGARVALTLMFALSGFAALAFQIAWVRLFSLVFGSSVYSFSAVLGVYLLGLALGSASAARFMRRGVTLADFARLQLGLAVVAALELQAFPRLPEWMYQLADRSGPRWSALFVGEIGLTALLLIVPCAMLGAAFPIATRLLQRRDGGHATGFAYAVNTAGTIAGSLAAGFFAIPRLGVQGTHLAALLIAAAVGLAAVALALARREARRSDVTLALSAAALVAVLSAIAPRWDPALMSAGAYRPIQAANLGNYVRALGEGGPVVATAMRTEHVLFYREGVNGSVLVGTDDEGKDRWLRVGGKIDASTNDMDTQTLLGLIPAALADSGARTLVIGLGSGITTAGVLAAGAGPTTVLEIEPGVVQASRFFFAPGQGPLDDPRVRVVLGDARTHLAHSGEHYGLIVSEPSNPWIAGVNNLFTVDFYRQVRFSLLPGGAFCQWMQLYELSPSTFQSMIASFLSVFPEGHVFAVWKSVDLLLVAVPEGHRLALERLQSPATRALLARAQIPAPEALPGYYSGPLASLSSVTRGATLNRDDRPVVEYRAPRDLVAVGRSSLYGDPRVISSVPFAPSPPAGPLFAAWSRPDWYTWRVRSLVSQEDTARAQHAAADARTAGLTQLAQDLQREIDTHERSKRSLGEMDRARQLLEAGRQGEALEAMERAVVIDPDDPRAWVMLANQRRAANDLTGAEQALAHGQSSDPEVRTQAAMVAGLIEIDRHQPLSAAERFREAQRWNPGLAKSYAFEARARLQGGDRTGARAALDRGLQSVPDDQELRAMLAQLERGQ